MRKTVLVLLAAFALALGGFGAGDAMAFRGGGHFGGGNVSAGHFGGGHFNGGRFHGGGFHRGHFHGHGGVNFAFGFGFPYYPYYYPYPYSYSTPVVVDSEPQVVVDTQASQGAGYWYYCSDPSGYYPYVKQCSVDWTKVAPAQVPED